MQVGKWIAHCHSQHFAHQWVHMRLVQPENITIGRHYWPSLPAPVCLSRNNLPEAISGDVFISIPSTAWLSKTRVPQLLLSALLFDHRSDTMKRAKLMSAYLFLVVTFLFHLSFTVIFTFYIKLKAVHIQTLWWSPILTLSRPATARWLLQVISKQSQRPEHTSALYIMFYTSL